MSSSSQIRAGRAARACAVVGLMLIVVSAGCSGGGGSGGDQNTGTGTVQGPQGALGGNAGQNSPVGGNPSGGSGDVDGPGSTITAGAGALPCDVGAAVKSNCRMCHGATPIGGAPMSLLTQSDFTRDYTAKTTMPLKGQTMKMYELARIRINGEMGTLEDAAGQGADRSRPRHAQRLAERERARGHADRVHTQMNPPTMQNPMGMAGSGAPPTMDDGSGNTISMATNSQCDLPGARDPLVARDGEICYEFQTHGQLVAGRHEQVRCAARRELQPVLLRGAVAGGRGLVALRFGLRQPGGTAPLADVREQLDQPPRYGRDERHRHDAGRERRVDRRLGDRRLHDGVRA